MTRSDLADLDKKLAQGPRLCNGALLGAGVGALLGWLSGRSVKTSLLQGAAGGVAAGVVLYGYGQWSSERARKTSSVAGEEVAGYRPSLSYPWSSH